MTPFSDDDLAAEVLRHGVPREAGPAPTDAAIAAWAEGRLDPERAAIVEAYLATHDDARALAFALRDDLLATDAPAGDAIATPTGGREGAAGAKIVSLDEVRARRGRWIPFAAAAAVLLAAGVLALRSGGGATSLDSDARLVAATGSLAHDAPGLFGDFRPIDAAERRAAVEDANRAGSSLLEPASRVLDVQPAVRWTSVNTGGWDADARFEVELANADGVVIWRHATKERFVAAADVPVLERGRSYLITVKAPGTLFGGGAGTRAFDVADDSTAAALASGRATARRLLGDDVGDLAFAHAAARKGFLVEAKRAATTYLARHPNDAAAREFDEYLRRRLGWPVAADARPR